MFRLATVLVLLAGLGRAGDRPVNIVVLYADDAGFADFGFQQGPAADMAKLTPHIDSIARAGVRFTNAYMSAAVCSPSRAGLMTGRNQCRFGHENNIPPGYMKGGMDLKHKTIADRLKALGYVTGLVGKWHLGYPPEYHPNKRGYDWFFGLLQGARSYVPLKRAAPNRVIQENGKPTPEGGYVTDRFGDAAVRFIGEHKAKPFYLFVSFTAPHGPLQAKAADLAALESIPKLKRRKYAGLVKAMDDNVGKVLAALRKHGLDKNTLVVFTNDNGGQTLTGANNAPLRGRKGQLFEGGIRVPMCMRWTGTIQPGATIDDPVISLDFMPTFVGVAGGKTDAEWRLDGVDLGPRLRGAEAALAPRPLFWRKDGPGREIAMRLGRYKLHFADREKSPEPALYDLQTDVAEQTDIAAKHEERVASMRKALAAWEAELESPRWTYGKRRRNRKK